MRKHGKKYLSATKQLDPNKGYDLAEALECALGMSFASFDENVDVAVRLGVDPRHADQMVRGSVMLPTGRVKKSRSWFLPKGKKKRRRKKQAPTLWEMTTYWKRSRLGG